MDLEGLRWEGYLRQDGALGIRNKVLVVYTVECAQFVAEEIARRSGDAETEVIGFAGCTDNAYAIRMLLALIRHPNVGAVLAVGLGCEYTQPERLAEAARKAGKPAEWFFIQDVGGTKPAIEKGVDLAVKLRKKLADTPRAPMGMSDLVVGAECGGSDYTSGLAGGLSTIEEKSMGAVIKSGSRPLQGVLKVGERAGRHGLWLLDTTPDPHWMQFGITNPNDNEGLMALIASGCHLAILVTGRGNVVGSAVAPVIKVTGNSGTYARMSGDMDFDAGPVLTGEETPHELGIRLAELAARVAGGEQTKGERLGHREDFIPYKYQDQRAGKTRRCEEEAI